MGFVLALFLEFLLKPAFSRRSSVHASRAAWQG
jgi:hypothetical protein